MAAEAKLAILQESYANALEVAETTSNFAEVGQARKADADRTHTEASLINSEVQVAIAERAVASAELCRLLNLDPSLRLVTVQARPLPVLTLVDQSYSVEQLIGVAMGMRPDLVARTAEVEEMQIHYRQERMRPLLPTLMVGFSAGTFGGGSNLQGAPYNVPQTFGAFGARTDFDAVAYWTAQNFGVGNVALWRERRAQRDQNFYGRLATINLLREQIASAYGLSAAGRNEITVCRARLANAEAGYVQELRRIQAGEGLPIELIDNLNRLVRARVALIEAIANYDRAQFDLFVALGQPPTLALPNAQALQSPAPMTNP
jgi:outer membrane protein TolC